MANADAAFGFVPVRHMSGSTIRTNKYTITSTLAENIFSGDLCILTSGGVITPHTATETNNIGVFAGVIIPHQMVHTFLASIGLVALLLRT